MYEAVTGRRILTGADEELPEVGAAFVGFAIVAVCLALLVLAIQFARLKSKTAASIVSVAVMIPCVGPCCVIGIPLGIWGLATIKKIPEDAWGRG
jgi:ABC-type proline/glycine betaine transport system permease subunit